ncbi:MAG TPA: transglutaminase-like domain-containing protein, partial [Anaerolineaceae bacterium]|nr:transglutaminase-like domain-containing protein [Anaerolineaceae bacterium]
MNTDQTQEMLSYYLQSGPMTDARECSEWLNGLPQGPAGLRDVVQGLAVHIFWAQRYGLELSEERKAEVQLRHVSQKLAQIQALDPRPLDLRRPLERRLVSNCRDFTVLMVTMLRAQGIPARSRCGFGRYFLPNHFEDHWVAEYWHPGQGRWVL